MQDLVQGKVEAEPQSEGDQEGERPKRRYLAEMVMPDGRSQQREKCNRQQDAGERHDPEQPQFSSIEMGSRTVSAGFSR